MLITKPLVLGLGGVGTLVTELLEAIGMEPTGVDKVIGPHVPSRLKTETADITNIHDLTTLMKDHDAVISCLPFDLTLLIAEQAHAVGIHYFDATEDVATTNAIRKLAETSSHAMIPQNGLAPGFIGIAGAYLANLCDDNKIHSIKLRVGALPQNPLGMLGYAGNWSLEGLVHEYIAECDVIMNGKRCKIAALRDREIIRIQGMEYEAFTTSGGLGTMTETFEGQVETLDYKSIRYPGHLDGMRLLLEEMRFKDAPDRLVERIRFALPPNNEDRVVIHASVRGYINDRLETREIVTDYKPIELLGKKRTAIAWTTATSISAIVEMVGKNILPTQGFVKQESIPLPAFLETEMGKCYLECDSGLDYIIS